MKQKHFMDIARAKESTELTTSNMEGFHIGDQIVIQTKFDGANASCRYDEETDTIQAFSRKQTLDFNNTLNGFWNYALELNKSVLSKYPNYVFFGEWSGMKNKIIYKPEFKKCWFMFDVYDVSKEEYLPQDRVKELAEELGVPYINTFYVGEFISWEHVRSFMDEKVYVDNDHIEEGVIVKNQTLLNNQNSRTPFVLKIVSEKFSEVMKNRNREVNPEVEAAKAESQAIVDQVVTKSRVEKMIYKLRDEGILPEKITPEDMKIVARNLPKRIYEDCIKEEPEFVKAAGEYFGKMCGSTAMKHAKEIILG